MHADDPADPLDGHERVAALDIRTRVYPTFRPDKALGVANPAAFNTWLERLGAAADVEIKTVDHLLAALKKRHDDFHAIGGRLSDHGLEAALAEPCSRIEAGIIFDAARAGHAASPADWAKLMAGRASMRRWRRMATYPRG